MTDTRVGPELAHRIDSRTLLGLLPGLDQGLLSEVRRQFGAFLAYPEDRRHRGPLTSWQQAWNLFTEAAPNRPGLITIRQPRCPGCNGRLISHRNISQNLSRTGNPSICGECRGTGRGSTVRQNAQYATPPEPPAEPMVE